MNVADIVVNLIALHGGELVGRTRLQKEAYLLHRCGANLDLPFIYHHYGPYSLALVDGLTDARAEGRIEIEERLGSYGIPLCHLQIEGKLRGPGPSWGPSSHVGTVTAGEDAGGVRYRPRVGGDHRLSARRRWLRYDAMEETKERKPLKATRDRMEQALMLLRKLGLEQEVTVASV